MKISPEELEYLMAIGKAYNGIGSQIYIECQGCKRLIYANKPVWGSLHCCGGKLRKVEDSYE